jgi:hypothetical protein
MCIYPSLININSQVYIQYSVVRGPPYYPANTSIQGMLRAQHIQLHIINEKYTFTVQVDVYVKKYVVHISVRYTYTYAVHKYPPYPKLWYLINVYPDWSNRAGLLVYEERIFLRPSALVYHFESLYWEKALVCVSC